MAAFDVGGLFSAVYRTQSLPLLTIHEEDKEQRLFLLECSRTLTGDYTSLRDLVLTALQNVNLGRWSRRLLCQENDSRPYTRDIQCLVHHTTAWTTRDATASLRLGLSHFCFQWPPELGDARETSRFQSKRLGVGYDSNAHTAAEGGRWRAQQR